MYLQRLNADPHPGTRVQSQKVFIFPALYGITWQGFYISRVGKTLWVRIAVCSRCSAYLHLAAGKDMRAK